MQIKASLKIACERRSSWQSWREETISVLEYHISNGLICQLLRDPLEDGMVVSQHVAEVTLKKAMVLQLFMRLMNFRDSAENSDVDSCTHAEELAIKAGLSISILKAFVYRCYN